MGFCFITRAREIQNKISKSYYNAFDQFEELRIKIEMIYQLTKMDNVEWEMCHNDICANNILLGKMGVISLIGNMLGTMIRQQT